MADKAHVLTDKKIEQMERHLSAIYSQEAKELGKKWTEYLENSGKHIDALQKEYDAVKNGTDRKAINEAKRKLESAKKGETLLNKRYKELSRQAAEQLAHVNETALAYVNGQLPEIYALNYNAFPQTVKGGLGGYSFELTDANTVKFLATTDKKLLPYKKLDLKKDVAWNTKRLNSEVLQGILQGESMPKIATRLGKVERMSEEAAIRNARTMVTSAENKGRLDSYHKAEDDGLILEKEWVATFDDRTRDWHSELDGQTAAIDEPFHNEYGDIMFPGDPSADPANVYNCRCTMVTVFKGFKKGK